MNVDAVVRRTAGAISVVLDRMVADLPEGATPQIAIELVVRDLARRQFWLMRLIMEDPNIREAYAEAVASLPATARRGPGGAPRTGH